MQKSQKKRRKKKFVRDVFLCGFPISGDKRLEKVNGFLFFRKGRGKMRNKLKKKKENFFFAFRELFHYFWSLGSRKR